MCMFASVCVRASVLVCMSFCMRMCVDMCVCVERIIIKIAEILSANTGSV